MAQQFFVCWAKGSALDKGFKTVGLEPGKWYAQSDFEHLEFQSPNGDWKGLRFKAFNIVAALRGYNYAVLEDGIVQERFKDPSLKNFRDEYARQKYEATLRKDPFKVRVASQQPKVVENRFSFAIPDVPQPVKVVEQPKPHQQPKVVGEDKISVAERRIQGVMSKLNLTRTQAIDFIIGGD